MQQGTYGDPKNQPQVPCRALRLSIKLIACDHFGSSQTIRFGANSQQVDVQRLVKENKSALGLNLLGAHGPPYIPFPYWARPSLLPRF